MNTCQMCEKIIKKKVFVIVLDRKKIRVCEECYKETKEDYEVE